MRLQVTNLFVLILIISNVTGRQIHEDKISVSLYYESLCPDCIEFISVQVNRARKSIGNYFDIEFVPYGNAETYPTNPPTFDCQHGKRECEGNKMHACAIKYIPETVITEFIICTMSTKDPPNAGRKCAQSLHVDFAPVQSCSNSEEGDQLLFNYGLRTKNLQPPHQYVPWILFDGKFSEDDNQKADTDLVRAICSKLQHAPEVCNSVDLF